MVDDNNDGIAHRLVAAATLGQVAAMTIALVRQVEEADGLPPRERRAAMLTVGIAIAISVLSTAIANIALPAMARELHATPAESIWVVNAYQLAVTISLLPFSALGDIIGYRRVYMWGLCGFTLASLACGLADTLPLLIGARILQGFGAAGIMSVNSALVRFIVPRAQLGSGISTITLVVAICSAAGPSIAAGILTVASWHWLFTFNVPFGILAVILALRSLPDTPRSGHRFDLVSAALNAATFGLLLVGLDGIGHGQKPIWVAAELAGGSVAAVVFIRRQNRMAAPVFPVDLFRSRVFALSVATSVSSYAAQTVAFLALPFYFAVAGGMSQSHIGLLITPWPAVVVVVAPIAGRLSDRYSAGLLGGLGLGILTAGLLLMLTLPADPGFVAVAWRMMVCGIGFGLFQTPNNRALLTAAPRSRSGVASGMVSTARLTGQTIGGVSVAVIFGLMHGDIGAAVGMALGAGATFSGVACAISFLRLRER
jgi:DHA2 family multidrug resistance protein-like MFS transporter